MRHSLENEFAEFWLDDGILFQVFKPDLKKITPEIARKIVEDRLPLFEGVPKPLFVDTCNARFMDGKTRNYFASEESILLVSASAFLLRSPASLATAKLFLVFNKPKVVTELFTNKDEALQWLEQFKLVTTV